MIVPDYADLKECARCGKLFPWYCDNCAASILHVHRSEIAPCELVPLTPDIETEWVCRSCRAAIIAEHTA